MKTHHQWLWAGAVAAGVGALAGCRGADGGGGGQATPAPGDAGASVERTVKIDSVTLGSGLVIEELAPGAGEMCLPNSWMRVRYVCRLPDGTQVDSSGSETLVLHLPRMIRGWQDGLPGMRVGGKRRLTVPAALGYGSRPMKDGQGNVVIPADSDLVYEVDLFGIEPPPSGG